MLAAAQDCVNGLTALGFSQVTLDLTPLPGLEEAPQEQPAHEQAEEVPVEEPA